MRHGPHRRLFAHEWAGVTPDIMMVAKGIGGGFPLGAVLATERAASGMDGGHPRLHLWRQPAGLRGRGQGVEIVSDPAFLAEVGRKGALFRQGLEALVAAHPDRSSNRARQGLMLGLKCRIAQRRSGQGRLRCRHVLTVPPPTTWSACCPRSTSPMPTSPRRCARLDQAATAVTPSLISSVRKYPTGVRGGEPPGRRSKSETS
jgi:acetylornithine/N-succinyldiaminopimelate aminotransferase